MLRVQKATVIFKIVENLNRFIKKDMTSASFLRYDERIIF